MGMGKRAKAVLASTVLASTALFTAAPVWAQELVGQPTPGGIGLQPAASPLKVDAHIFHDAILMPVITVICLLVLGLLLWIAFRYNKRRNPVPARWSHNTVIEIIWTIVPVLILIVIAVFSFRLLFDYHDIPEPDVTVKVTGNQWSWTYEYPDHGVGEYVSNMMPEAEARAQGLPYLLAAYEPMVVPVGQNVQLLITASTSSTRWRFRLSASRPTPFLAASTRPGSAPTAPASSMASAPNCAAWTTPSCRSRSMW